MHKIPGTLTGEADTDRLGRLQRIAAALSGILTTAEVAAVVIGEIASDVGAMPLLWLLNDDESALELVSPDVHPPAAPFSVIPADADLPGAVVVRTGVPIFVSGPEQRARDYPQLEVVATDAAFGVLPMTADDVRLGVLAVGYGGSHTFEEGEKQFVRTIADLTAAALLRARLHSVERRSSERLRFLAEASSVLAESLDYHETLTRVVGLIVPGLAEMATVHLYDDEGELRRVALAHHDAGVEADLRRYLDSRDFEIRSEELVVAAKGVAPVTVRDARRIVARQRVVDDEHARVLNNLCITSGTAQPLVARGEVLGVLTFLRVGDAPPFTAEDEQFAAEVARRAALAVDNARLHARRIEVAHLLQASLLPPELPEIPGVELAAAYYPAGEGIEVGGDFYDVFAVAGGWAFMIGDVAGTGPSAAARTAVVRHTARAIARTGAPPEAVVGAVNDALLAAMDVERFCTMVFAIATVDHRGTHLRVVGAGHPAPLIVLADGTVRAFDAAGTLLGVVPDVTYAGRSALLAPGDTMLLYTDGVVECRLPTDDENGIRLFGDAGLFEAAAGEPGRSAGDIIAQVETALRRHSGGQFADDVAMLAIRSR